MRVLFDCCHPAHVHLFKNAIFALQRAGHETYVVSREKEVTTDLLDAYGIQHVPLSAQGEGGLAMAIEWTKRELRLLRHARRFGPDVVVSALNPAAAHVSSLLGVPNVMFNDNEEAARMLGPIAHRFADAVCTPAAFADDLGSNHRTYNGFHELAYLHPDRFKPDPDLLERNGVDPNSPYSVLRLVSWAAYHDAGREGLSASARQELVDTLDAHGDVYITSESPLPDEFEQYRLPVPPEAIHDLLAFADCYVGDSHTMAIEAGILGTPAVRFNFLVDDGDLGCYTELERDYGLVYSTPDEREGLDRVAEIIGDEAAAETWDRRRHRLVAEKIDVTDFILDRIFELGPATRTERPGGSVGEPATEAGESVRSSGTGRATPAASSRGVDGNH